jgi:hypothetical protein
MAPVLANDGINAFSLSTEWYRRLIGRSLHRRSGKANGADRHQIQTKENEQFHILLPQKQDKEEFILKDAFKLCVLQQVVLYAVLNGNDREPGEPGDPRAQAASFLKNEDYCGNG